MAIETSGIHIEPTNICTLKCSGCARTLFINQWPRQWKNSNLDIDLVLRFLDIDLNNQQILLCGNYGDPIYHPEFIDFVKALKDRGSTLKIITNGSHKKSEWWQDLVKNLSSTDTVIFSIDGLPENFTEYRQNADWDSILEGIKVCVASSVTTKWKYIPFSFNQTHIDQARQLSHSLGFDEFFLDPSKRFDDSPTQHLQPAKELINPEYHDRLQWKSTLKGQVRPKCQNNFEHFISADGHYSPCCYVADHRFYYKTMFGKNKSQYSITDNTLSQLLAKPEVIEFYQNLNSHPVCQFSCPA